jgi:hypothetical protein
MCLRSIDICCHDGGSHLICRRINADNPRAAATAGDAGYRLSTRQSAGKNILWHLTIDTAELCDLRITRADRIVVATTARQDQQREQGCPPQGKRSYR